MRRFQIYLPPVLAQLLIMSSTAFAQTGFLQPLPPVLVEGSHSINGNTSTSVTFWNVYWNPVTVYWLDYSGSRVNYATLGAFGSYTQPTYVTHPWIATDSITSVDVTGFMPQASPSYGVVIKLPGTVAELPHPSTPASPLEKRLYENVATFGSVYFGRIVPIVAPECLLLCSWVAGIYDAWGASLSAGDPFDPNYRTVSAPATANLPTLPTDSSLSADGNAAMLRMLNVGASLLSIANATEVVLNRADTARADGQTTFEQLQFNAARGFMSQTDLGLVDLTSAMRQFDSAFPSSGLAQYADSIDALNPVLGAVPEPGTWLLLAIGLSFLAWRFDVKRWLNSR